jgi:Kef-type K+ transport system membrane component KefB
LLNLAIVGAIAFAVPYVLGLFPKVRIPPAVVELLAGIILGPSVLALVKIDAPVDILSQIGVVFLLFLAGMELDLDSIKGPPLILGAVGFGLTLVIALGAELAFSAKDLVLTPLLVAVALSATSVGIVIPILRDSGRLQTQLGRFAVAGGTVAEFGTIVLLGLFFAKPDASAWAEAATLLLIAVASVGLLFGLARFSRSPSAREVFARLDQSSSQIRVRLAVAVLLAAVVLAVGVGFEAVLGAFLAGGILGAIVRTWHDEEGLRSKLDAVGFGVFVPVFFIASGMRFEVSELFGWFEILSVLVLTLVLLAARGLPALLYRKHLSGREMLAVGLLQATNLSFIVVAVSVGEGLGAITNKGGEILIAAGMLSALIFPFAAQMLLSRADGAQKPGAAAVPTSSRRLQDGM